MLGQPSASLCTTSALIIKSKQLSEARLALRSAVQRPRLLEQRETFQICVRSLSFFIAHSKSYTERENTLLFPCIRAEHKVLGAEMLLYVSRFCNVQ
jgi:hypothetical protein